MQVNFSINNNMINNSAKNKVSFSGQRLYKVPLMLTTDTLTKPVVGYFTKLDESDIPLLKDIYVRWKQTRFGGDIISQAIKELSRKSSKEHDYFMVESLSDNRKIERVKALCGVKYSENPKGIMVGYVQSSSNLLGQNTTRGAGSGIFYGLSKYAEAKNLKYIDLTSANARTDLWYHKLGFQGNNCGAYFLMLNKDFSVLRKNVIEKILKLNNPFG